MRKANRERKKAEVIVAETGLPLSQVLRRVGVSKSAYYENLKNPDRMRAVDAQKWFEEFGITFYDWRDVVNG